MWASNMATNTKQFGDYTWLPLQTIIKEDSTGFALIVKTPHKGEVIIDSKKQEFHGFMIFGSHHTVDKETEAILKQIYQLQSESAEYLINQWLLKNK